MSQRQQTQQARNSQAPATVQTTSEPSQPETRQGTARVLRLRGGHTTNGRSVQWAEDVVDNEGLGRKSSKVCCIYHKPKAVGESSDESSSDSSDSDSDSDSGAESKRKVGDGKNDCGHAHNHRHRKSKKKDEKRKRSPSPNAYEKVPKYKTKPQESEKTKS